MDSQQFIYTIYIASTPEKVFEALTTPEFAERYWSGCRVESDWRLGSPFALTRDGEVHSSGEVLEYDPPHHLGYTWTQRHMHGLEAEGPSRVAFEIEPLGTQVRLTITHSGFEPGSKVIGLVGGSWPIVLSSLKSLLETGTPLTVTRRDGGEPIVESTLGS